MQFTEHNFKGIGSLISLPSTTSQGQRIFIGASVSAFFGHSQLSVALKTAKCVKFDGSNRTTSDYTTLSRKEYPDLFKILVESSKKFDSELNSPSNSLAVTNKTNNLTLLTESGVWKLAMASRLEKGIQLRDWLAREVLPSISSTGMYVFKPTTQTTNVNQLHELKRLTNQAEQIQESKDVNRFKYEQRNCKWDILNYNKANHKQVHNRSVKELKTEYPDMKSKSGKDILRVKEPAIAVTMAFNDFMVQQGGTLENLKEIDKAMPQMVQAFLNYGFTVEQIFTNPNELK